MTVTMRRLKDPAATFGERSGESAVAGVNGATLLIPESPEDLSREKCNNPILTPYRVSGSLEIIGRR